jgi:hypothetical protein
MATRAFVLATVKAAIIFYLQHKGVTQSITHFL